MMANHLLGMFQNPQQNQMQALLGQYYNPKQAMWQAAAGHLEGIGRGLMGNGPSRTPITFGSVLGDAMRGGVEGSQNALDQYQQKALLGYKMAGEKRDEDWQAKERARKESGWESDDANDAQMNALIGSIQDPQEQLFARSNPKAWVEWKLEPKTQKWGKLTDGSLFNEGTGEVKTVTGSTPTADFKDVNSIRKEVQDTPQIKNYMQSAPIYRSMVETAPRNSRASDLNLVYGLGKIMDPTSVVREGEMVMVKNTASLPDWLQGAIASLNGGAALTPATRAAIMNEAKSRMNAYANEARGLKRQYEGIAQRHNITLDDIWQQLPELPDYVPSGGAGQPNDGWQVEEIK